MAILWAGHGLPYDFHVECFILDHYDKEVAFLADTNQLLNFLIRMNQVEPRVMLPADVIWIDFKYNFLTAYFLWRENLYSLYQKPDDSNGVAKILVVEFQTIQNQYIISKRLKR